MKIIRRGKYERQVFETLYGKGCPKCYCQFRFYDNETYCSDLIYDHHKYIKCPWCGHEVRVF